MTQRKRKKDAASGKRKGRLTPEPSPPVEPEEVLMVEEEGEEPAEAEIPELQGAKGREGDAGAKPAVYDPVAAYYQSVRHYPVLSREEEKRLALKYVKKGDIEAAYGLVTSNLRLVIKIAMEYRRLWREIVDLIQEGNVGLMQAVKKYDPYRGVRFSSYAAWWIRAYIIRYIMNNARMVKLGTTQAQRTLYFQLSRERDRLRRMGIEPDSRALADSLQVKESEVEEMSMRLRAGDLSLDAATGRDDSSYTMLDALPSSTPDAEELVADAQSRAIYLEKLSEFVATLEERDRRIFTMRWMRDESLTLQEIGDKLGITRERVRQLETRILKNLKDYLEEQGLSARDFLD